MRLHHLTITAFGPFATTVEVDFDELSAAGLFLLTGSTGAGKSSVLDAVCFGLYGEVPGDRDDAKHLRSDHAAPDLAPCVVLEFSVGSRHFRFTRSPAWERSKKRGSGTTRQQAGVVVEERQEGSWQTLTTRLDDAGLLITNLLGMTCTQFTQVALLPQGRFQAFLRATSTERHAVLQRLFRTDRFERVEHWLADRRRELRRVEHESREKFAAVVHRFSEVTDQAPPGEWELGGLAAALSDGSIERWFQSVAEEATAHVVECEKQASSARDRHHDAAASHRHGLDTARLQESAATARATLSQLAESECEHRARVKAVAEHYRAESLEPAIDRAARAASQADQSRRRLNEALDFAAAPDPTADSIAQALAMAIREEQDATSALERMAERDAARAAEAEALGDLEGHGASLEQVKRALEESTGVLALHEAETLACEQHARKVDPLRVAHAEALQGLAAARLLDSAETELIATERVLRIHTERAQVLREAHLDAREARISAMAGELAGQLASGCSCPVCGSIEHPAPARTDQEGSRQQEEAALRAWETADSLRMAAHESMLAARARHHRAHEDAAGRTRAEWTAEEATQAAALADAEAAAERLPRLRDLLVAAREHHEQLGRDLAAGQATREQLRSRLDEARAATADAESAYVAALDGFEDPQARVDHYRDLVVRLARARDARTHAAQDKALAGQAFEALQAAVAEAGFESAGSAHAAIMAADEVSEAERAIAAHEERRRAAQAVLDSPDVLAAAGSEAVDTEALAHELDQAESVRVRAEAALTRANATSGRVTELAEAASKVLTEWRPLHEHYELVERISTIAEGTSPQNALKMRLSAYVLGERLRQVVAAANERLAAMTDQRYALEHSDERAVGARRGGLSLLMRDDWTGIRRDPATLSGGETFVVSLALALGLADTVAHEAGGVPIDTLFIDEGFGSLDSETLDDVMDTLDGLRNSGRVVGVVSHVAEMRERIPAGVEIRKTRTGSMIVAR